MTKVIVFSDIKIYCEGLSKSLAKVKPIEVIGVENNFDDAIARINLDSPDVILLDMTMKDSCRIAQEVMGLCPEAKIVALAVLEDEENIVECAQVGIAGYVPREASLDELIDTVIGAKKGEFCCPPKIAAYIFNKIHDLASSAKDKCLPNSEAVNANRLTGLTRREQQIMRLMADGLSNKLISRDLNIEVSTVKNHVHNILVKLDVKSRARAVSLLQGPPSPSGSFRSLDWSSLGRVGRY